MIDRCLAIALLALTMLGSTAWAQTPQGAASATDPAALPGNFVDLPQAAQLHVPLGPPPGMQARRRAEAAAPPGPGDRMAINAAGTALAACTARGYAVAVAVTDSVGNLNAAVAADGAGRNRMYMALRKDVTVVKFGVSTLALRSRIAADGSLMAQVTPNMALLPGGIPILKDGRLVGAIAASGASAYVEEDCAKAGAAWIAGGK